MNRTKVIHIITGLGTGGAEIMLGKLLERIDKNQFDSVVISLKDRGDLADKIESYEVPVYTCAICGIGSLLPGLFKLYRYIIKERSDIVQTWLYHADLIGGIVSKFAGVKKVIWNIRNSNLDRDKTKLSTIWVVKFCALLSGKIPSIILSNSVNSAVIHQKIGYKKEKFKIIPNGFDISKFKPDVKNRMSVRSEFNISKNKKLVGLIARFDSQKNHKGFIRAAALIKKKYKNVHFIMAGTGIDWDNKIITSQLNGFGLSESFSLLGRRDDIPRIMASLDVLASSSYGEAFPNVLGEAMACGVPCVVTDVGDCADIIGDTGYVVEVDDIESLAERIINIFEMDSNNYKILSQKARTRVLKLYKIDKIVKEYEEVYANLAERV